MEEFNINEITRDNLSKEIFEEIVCDDNLWNDTKFNQWKIELLWWLVEYKNIKNIDAKYIEMTLKRLEKNEIPDYFRLVSKIKLIYNKYTEGSYGVKNNYALKSESDEINGLLFNDMVVRRCDNITANKNIIGEIKTGCIEINATSSGIYKVWFGTTRLPIDESDLNKGFKNERGNGDVHYGKCNVFIPKSHRFGETGRSWFERWIKFDFENDNLKLKSIIPCRSESDFWSDLKNELSENEGDALVFLHGYNNSFEDSAIRAAQIGFDLKVSGVTAFFSWPSKSDVSGYPDDVASIEASEEAITNFLLDFTKKSGATKVHLIAHSMGNRGLVRALNNIQHKLEKDSKVPFGQIILAAPDLDVQLFKNLAYLYPKLSERTTLYTSPKDKAVALSKWLHDYPRVGIVPPITIVKDIDTIKVEIEGFSLFELGHGYFAEAESILHDIFDLLRHNSKPSDRQRLSQQQTEIGDVYWLMKS